MKTRRIIPGRCGSPALEPVRDELFDTKELFREGQTALSFFSRPNDNFHVLTNMPTYGQLSYPQQAHIFGLTIEAYSVHTHIDEKIIKAKTAFDELRRMLFENASVRFVIGCKDYLNVPVNSVIEGIIPGNIEGTKEGFYKAAEVNKEDVAGAPELEVFAVTKFIAPRTEKSGEKKVRELLKDYPLQIIIGNANKNNFYNEFTIQRPNGKTVRVTVTDIERRKHFFNLCIFSHGIRKPLHIPSQQAFRAEIQWAEPISYDPDLLGKVFVRVGLPCVRLREIQ